MDRKLVVSDNNEVTKHGRFFHPPSEAEIEEYGPFIATARSDVEAERKSSRMFSFMAVLANGTLVTAIKVIETGTTTFGQAMPNFAVPILVNAVAQFRTEKVQRRETRRYGALAVQFRQEAIQQQDREALLEARVELYRSVIEEAGLEVPPDPIRPLQNESDRNT